MKKILVATLIFALLIPIGVVAENPTISMETDTIELGEIAIVNGNNYVMNETVTINIISMETGTQYSDVANGTVDENGTFSLEFEPETTGNFYVIALSDSAVAQATLKVEKPVEEKKLSLSADKDEIPIDEELIITVNSEILTAKNYIVIMKDVGVQYDITRYEVLHNGIAIFEHTFTTVGEHNIVVYIEGMENSTTRTKSVIVNNKTDDGGGNNNPIQNETYVISVRKSKSIATAQVIKKDQSVVMEGQLRVTPPTTSSFIVQIEDGEATFQLSEVGEYKVTYTEGESTYRTEYDYKPNTVLEATPFNENGITYLTLKINGEKASSEFNINVDKPTGDTFITLYNGQGTFTAQETGTYRFTVDDNNYTATTSISWNEDLIISGLSATQDGDDLTITGTVKGKNTGTAKAGEDVDIVVEGLGISHEVTSDSKGKFYLTIDVSENKQSFLSNEKTKIIASTNMDNEVFTSTEINMGINDYIFNFWTFLLFVAFIILAYLKGWLYRWTNHKYDFLDPSKRNEGKVTGMGFHRTGGMR